MPAGKFVVFADFDNAVAAHSVRILLEASGIEARVHGDFSVEIGSVDRVMVLVPENDLQLARTVVNEIPAASDVLVPEWRCACGKMVDEGFQVCWSCGRSNPEFEDA